MRTKLLFLFFFFIFINPLFPQTFNPNFWVTNGTVNAIANDSDMVYVGGNFTRVSPATGPATPLSVNGTGDTLANFPRVSGGTGLTSQTIRAIIPDGAGGWYIGGNFHFVNGIADTNIAHINSDFSVDASWTPHAGGGEVYCIALHNNLVYIGGNFTRLAGTIVRPKLACIDATTGTVMGLNISSWAAPAAIVKALAATDDNLYVGGTFTQIGGVARKGIAAINVSNSALPGTVTGWDPGTAGGCSSTITSTINTLLISGNTIYAGGTFNALGGCGVRRNIVQIDTATGLNTNWRPWISGAAPANNITVDCIKLKGDTLYASGNFNTFNGINRKRLVAINTLDTGSILPIVVNIPTVGSTVNLTHVYNIAIYNNFLFAAGNFTTTGTVARNFLAKLNLSTGSTDSNWNPNPNQAPVYALAVSGDTLYAGGAFTGLGGVVRNRVYRFNANTGIPDTWAPNIPTAGRAVNSIAIGTNSVFLGGTFDVCNGVRNKIVEIPKAGNGQTNTTWPVEITGAAAISVNTMVFSPAKDTLYIGGNFTTANDINGSTFKYVAALNPNSAYPYDWNLSTGPDGIVYSLALRGNQLYVGGSFSNVNGVPRKRLARMLTDDYSASTSVVDNWNPGTPTTANNVFCIALNNDSVLYAGGSFTALSGTSYLTAINVNDTGTVISGFLPNISPVPSGIVKSIYLKDDSVLYVGGAFTKIQGLDYYRAAALNAYTGTPYDWHPNINYIQANNIATCMVNAIGEGAGTLFLGGAYLTCTLQNRPVSNFSGFTGSTCVGTFVDAGPTSTMCWGDSLQLSVTPGLSSYSWAPPNGLSNPNIANPKVCPSLPGTYVYTLTAINIAGCTNVDDVTVIAYAIPAIPEITIPNYTPPDADAIYFCTGTSKVLKCDPPPATQYLWSNGDTDDTTTVSLEGSYTVTVYNSVGCPRTSLPTTVIHLPETITPVATISTDSTHALTDCSGSLSYQWYFAFGIDALFAEIATNGTACIYDILSNGCFYVKTTESGLCQSSPSDTVCRFKVVGNDEINIDNQWNIFPNPAQGTSIVSVLLSESTEITIEVYDIPGRKILTPVKAQHIRAGEQYQFPLRLKNAGVYFVEMKCGNGKGSVKRIVKN